MVVRHKPILALAAPLMLLLSMAGAAFSVGFRMEAEKALAPNGNATVRTGPSAGPTVADIVSVDSNPNASNGAYVGYFDYWEWLEWEVDVPEDGLYEASMGYATNGGVNGYVNLAISTYQAGPQVTNAVVPITGNYVPPANPPAAITDELGTPVSIPLKAGVQRIRLQIRPDPNFGAVAGWLNMDFWELTKTAAFPSNLGKVSGTVTVSVGGTPTPLEGALVSVGDEITQAKYLARTDADGKYSMYLPTTSQTLTVLMNGWQKVTANLTPPATRDFNLTVWSGKLEAELLDSTNTGREFGNGVQPEYTTALNSNNLPLSNYGQIVFVNLNRYAEWKHVYAPQAGVYDLGQHYSAGTVGTDPPYGRTNFTTNGGVTTELRYDVTSVDFLTYADSVTQLVELKAGKNALRLANPDPNATANVDYLSINPTTKEWGYLKVLVQSQTGMGLTGATVKVASRDTGLTGTNYIGPTAGDGSFQVPCVPGTYDITVTRTGKTATATGTVTVGTTTTVIVTLTVTSVTVEAESLLASGPSDPSVVITDLPTASNGKVIEGLTAVERPEWVEWNLQADQDGLYQLVLGYSTASAGTGAHTFWLRPTNYLYNIADGIPPTAGVNDYQVFVYPTLVPLKTGANTLRMSMNENAGALNLDYITYERISALAATKNASGTVKGSDGTGQGNIQNASLFINTADPNIGYLAKTSATGQYVLTVPSTQGFVIGASAEGYTTIPPASRSGFGNITWNPVMSVNNLPTSTTPPTMQVFARSAVLWDQGINMDWLVENQPLWGSSPGKFYEFVISMPRSGTYQMGMWYSSGWNSDDGQPVRTTFTLNGTPIPVSFPKTTAWADYVVNNNVASLPFNAGPNTMRLRFDEAGANIGYFTFIRTGDVVKPPVDINNDGKVTLLDAVLYSRRLNSLDPGAKPDLTGNGTSGAEDVVYLMQIAGGLAAG